MAEIGFNFTDITINKLDEYRKFIEVTILDTIESVVNCHEIRFFNNTVQPIINVETLTEPYTSIFNFVVNFYPDKELRDYANELQKEINKFNISVFLRKDLYNAFLEYRNSTYDTEKRFLTPEEIRYFEHSMRDFKRAGLHLPNDQYNRMKNIIQELSDLSQTYEKNINDENTWFSFSKEQLDGMPEYWFVDEKKLEGDSYKVTLKYPDLIPVLEYVKNEDVRKQMYVANNNRCHPENTNILTKAIELRYQQAALLGYKHYADYATEVKIIKTGQNAIDFQINMDNKFTNAYQHDMINLLLFAKTRSSIPLKKDHFDSWDLSYYVREYTESVCDLNMEELRNYFPAPVVKAGLFNIYQTLLGLNFAMIPTNNKWHPDVELYCVTDKATDEILGYFYLDLFPREGKFSHAAAFDFMTGCDMSKINGCGRRYHIMAMACNFAKDGCIDFDDVVTFFHEFGHIMHQICSRPQLKSHAGFGIEYDFVEAPSQMLENWCYTKEALAIMSCHKDTKQPVSQEIIDKLIKKKTFLASYVYKRQIVFGTIDLALHTMTEFAKDLDVNQLFNEIYEHITGITSAIKVHRLASFGHIMSNGYASGYFGYLLAETYAAHMFGKIFKNNVLNPDAGMQYRKRLLEPGSSRDAMELLVDFLGEQPSEKYFIDEYIEKNKRQRIDIDEKIDN